MKWERIFIHCSDSNYGSAVVIDQWHRERNWKSIGYHFVISNGFYHPQQKTPWSFACGSVEAGRPIDDDSDYTPDEIGSHVYGFNTGSIGICLIGKTSFFRQQLQRLKYLVTELQQRLDIPSTAIYGHCEAGLLDPKYATPKTCPNLPMNDLRAFLAGVMDIEEFFAKSATYVQNLNLKP